MKNHFQQDDRTGGIDWRNAGPRKFPLSAFRSSLFKKRASSLITSLLVLVVLSTIVVAFMQSMSIERAVARSVANKLKSQLVAQAGLEVATHMLTRVASQNPAFVIGLSGSQTNSGGTLVAGYRDLTNIAEMMPLFSGNLSLLSGYPTNQTAASVQAYLSAQTNISSLLTADLNSSQKRIEAAATSDKYRAPWVSVTNSAGSTNGRYAFIILDEWARVNPQFHGAGNDRTNSTNWFSGPGAIPLQTTSNRLLTQIEASNSRALGVALLSPHLLGQAFASRVEYETKKHLLSIAEVPDLEVIPNHYPDGGKPKFNINNLATNIAFGATPEDRAGNIASIISSNLPQFSSRDVGTQLASLPGTIYLNRLAASIVDYIDSDSATTTANNGEPAGMELAPFAVMFAEKNTWISEAPAAPAPPPVTVTIRTELFVQLWNPNTVPVSGSISVKLISRQYVELPDGGPQTDFSEYNDENVAVILQPNEIKAIKFQAIDQDFVHPTQRPSSSSARHPRWPATSSGASSLTGHPQFQLFWNGILSDMNRQEPIMDSPANAGLTRSGPGGTFGPVGTIRWSFNFCPPNSPNTVGDPRSNYLVQSDWAALNNINSARWQGRQTDTGGRTQNFQTTWAQRDFIRENLPEGIAMSSPSVDPTTLLSSYNSTNASTAPAVVRNSPMNSIAELGNIYDPSQVSDTGGNVLGGSPGSFFRPAGGRSLRVGQPEFQFSGGASSWDVDGKRAVQLLDLFTTQQTNSFSSNVPAAFGRINLNTAPQEVLEALFMNIQINSDPAAGGASINATNAAALATEVIKNRPYSRISEIYRVFPVIASGTNFSIPLPTQVGGGTTNLALMDRAREEVFGKYIELITVRGRAFRVYVVGQALDERTGRILSESFCEASLALDNQYPSAIPQTLYLRFE